MAAGGSQNASETRVAAADAVRKLVEEELEGQDISPEHKQDIYLAALRALDGMATHAARFELAKRTPGSGIPTMPRELRIAVQQLPPLGTTQDALELSLRYGAVAGGFLPPAPSTSPSAQASLQAVQPTAHETLQRAEEVIQTARSSVSGAEDAPS